MGTENVDQSCNTVTVTGDINISPTVMLLTESNSYSNRCYSVTTKAKNAVTGRGLIATGRVVTANSRLPGGKLGEAYALLRKGLPPGQIANEMRMSVKDLRRLLKEDSQ
jgi:hypothetical protein